MSPAPARPAVVHAVALALIALLSAACGGAVPTASFDPSGPCTVDGRVPGAYPELEALLPAAFREVGPTRVDSGRSCTADALGTLADRGIEELRFAGAVWDLGSGNGVTYAVFRASGLDPVAVIEFYEAGARASGKTDALQVTDVEVAGREGRRLDALVRRVGESIVAWPGDEAGEVRVLLTAGLGETELTAALDELAP